MAGFLVRGEAMIIPLLFPLKAVPIAAFSAISPSSTVLPIMAWKMSRVSSGPLPAGSERTIAMSLLFMAVPSQPFRWRNRKPCWNLSCLIVRLAILRTYAFPPGLMP